MLVFPDFYHKSSSLRPKHTSTWFSSLSPNSGLTLCDSIVHKLSPHPILLVLAAASESLAWKPTRQSALPRLWYFSSFQTECPRINPQKGDCQFRRYEMCLWLRICTSKWLSKSVTWNLQGHPLAGSCESWPHLNHTGQQGFLCRLHEAC